MHQKKRSEESSDESESEEENGTAPMKVDESKKRSAPVAEIHTPAKAQKIDVEQTPSTPSEQPNTTVFLRNVNYNTVESTINSAFSKYGPIKEVRINFDKMGGSRGSAFVEYATVEGAKASLEFSGQEIDGKIINVEFANPRKPFATPRTGDRGTERRSFAPSTPTGAPSKTLYVGNLSYDSTAETLREAFTNVKDSLSDVRVMYGQDGQSRGFAYMEFDSVESAGKGLENNGIDVDGRAIRLDYAAEKTGGGPPRERSEGFGGGRGGRGGFGGRGGGGFGGGRGGRGGARGGKPAFAGKKTTFS